MTTSHDAKIQSEISACFSKLKVKDFDEASMLDNPEARKPEANQPTFDAAANVILNLSKTPEKIIRPRNFVVDKYSTPKELCALADLFDKFSDELIEARAKLNADAISELKGGLLLTGLSQEFQELSEKIHMQASEYKSNAKPLRGAPKNLRAIFVAQTIATYYHRITGYKPTIIKNHYPNGNAGPYYNLVVEIFGLLDIQGNRRHYAEEALRTLGFLGR